MSLVPSLTLYCIHESESAGKQWRVKNRHNVRRPYQWLQRVGNQHLRRRTNGSKERTHLAGSANGGNLLDTSEESKGSDGEDGVHDVQTMSSELRCK